MKRTIGFGILNCAAAFVAFGGCFDMLIPVVPSNLAAFLGIAKAEMSPQLSLLLLGLLRALGGCLLGIGITAFSSSMVP
jgi:hypothetical protein